MNRAELIDFIYWRMHYRGVMHMGGSTQFDQALVEFPELQTAYATMKQAARMCELVVKGLYEDETYDA